MFGVRRWVWNRLTPAGSLLLWGIVATASFTDVGQTMSHQLLAFLGCVFLSSLIWTHGRHARCAVERLVPRHGSVGSVLPCRVRIRNLGRRWLRGAEYREDSPDPRPSVQEFHTLVEPGEARRNWFDRRYRFYRWRWLCLRNTRLRPQPVPIPDLPPGGETEVVMALMPLRRGRLTLDHAEITRTDPFGLLRRGTPSRGKSVSVMVYPRRFPLPPLELPGISKRLHTGGIALAGAVGDTEEFMSVREYRPGDPLRKIHWAGWARTLKPVVKEFQEEYFVRHALLLDTFGGGEEADAFEAAVSLAASFACTIDDQETLLDLMFVGDRAYVFTAGRGLAHSAQMLEILAGVDLHPAGQADDLEQLVLRHLQQLSGCVLILLHWDEARRALRQGLEAREVPTLTFIVRGEPAPAGLTLPPNTHWIAAGEAEAALSRLGG